jgi:hypothetical protein
MNIGLCVITVTPLKRNSSVELTPLKLTLTLGNSKVIYLTFEILEISVLN